MQTCKLIIVNANIKSFVSTCISIPYLTTLVLLGEFLDNMEVIKGEESFFTTGGADFGEESNGDRGGSKFRDPTECLRGEGFSTGFLSTDRRATSGDVVEEKTEGFSEIGELGDLTML
jgi:hypothetical protein